LQFLEKKGCLFSPSELDFITIHYPEKRSQNEMQTRNCEGEKTLLNSYFLWREQASTLKKKKNFYSFKNLANPKLSNIICVCRRGSKVWSGYCGQL